MEVSAEEATFTMKIEVLVRIQLHLGAAASKYQVFHSCLDSLAIEILFSVNQHISVRTILKTSQEHRMVR